MSLSIFGGLASKGRFDENKDTFRSVETVYHTLNNIKHQIIGFGLSEQYLTSSQIKSKLWVVIENNDRSSYIAPTKSADNKRDKWDLECFEALPIEQASDFDAFDRGDCWDSIAGLTLSPPCRYFRGFGKLGDGSSVLFFNVEGVPESKDHPVIEGEKVFRIIKSDDRPVVDQPDVGVLPFGGFPGTDGYRYRS